MVRIQPSSWFGPDYVEEYTSCPSTRNYESRRITVKHGLRHNITPAEARVTVCSDLVSEPHRLTGKRHALAATAREFKRKRMLDAANKHLSICKMG
jgi:hypothetical protein